MNGSIFVLASLCAHLTSSQTVHEGSRAQAEAEARLAELNWQTCLQDQAGRLAMTAVEARAPRPSAAAAFQECASLEQVVQQSRTQLERSVPGTAVPADRERLAEQIQEQIDATYRALNHD